MFSTVTLKGDIRDIPEYKSAAKGNDDVWMAEELTGYWLAKSSGAELTRDLFMRISRKESAIRVQRGCLAKELAYGVQQIREIQKSI